MTRGGVALACLVVACGSPPPHAARLPPTRADAIAQPPSTLAAADRAALAQVVALPDGAVARTAAGNLMRYDSALVRTAERRGAYAALAVDGADLFAAQTDGGLVALDPATLAPTPLGAAAPGRPVWLAALPAALVVAVDLGHDGAYDLVVLSRASGAETGRLVVPTTGNPKHHPGTWFLDRAHGAVWFGADGGEWGGALGRVDLATGAAGVTPGALGGVYGLVRGPDNRLWVHGGTAHLGHLESFISAVSDDGATVTELWSTHDGRRGTLAAAEPLRAVSAIIPRADVLVVLAGEDVFGATPDLARWTHLAHLPATARGGRPDATSSYPAVASVAASADGRVIFFATRGDGLFALRAGGLVRVD